MDRTASRMAVQLKPDRPDAGSIVTVSVAPESVVAQDEGRLHAFVLDAGGQEISSGPVGPDPEDGRHRAVLEARAPSAVGRALWTVILRDMSAEEPVDLDRAEVEVETVAHQIRPVVWGVPTAVEAGGVLRFTVGLRCTSDCCAAGWTFSVVDDGGDVVFEGAVGGTRASGTDRLHCTEVGLRAPAREGRVVWNVRPDDPKGELAHIVRPLEVVLNVTARPDGVIRVRAVDAATQAPVERAKVVAHPFRTFTDAEGRAELPVPAGAYAVFVSGQQYFPERFSVDVDRGSEIEIEADMHLDRAYDEVDQWA